MAIAFTKMHGLGNDFVVIDGRALVPAGVVVPAMPADEAVHLADRRRGIGCDQLIILEPPRSVGADLFMRIRNPDGSEAGACGNATRCVAALEFARRGIGALTIETIAGLLPCRDQGGGLITAVMGAPRFGWQDLPLAAPADTLHLPVTTGPLADGVGVSMGNPHAVFFVDDAEAVDLERFGPLVERHALFPQRTNVEVVSVRDPGSTTTPARLRMRVWERGAGVTLACGSGACAAAVAAARRGLAARSALLDLDGGTLRIDWRDDDLVAMTGPHATAFVGVIPDEAVPGWRAALLSAPAQSVAA